MTTPGTTNRCTQPGCPGTVEDGYCVVCGMPPAQASSPVPSPRPPSRPAAAPAAPPAAGQCAQPGCGGAIEDGYCNVCGAPGATPTTISRRGTGGTGGTPASAASRGSLASGSTRTGSVRTGSIRTGSTRTSGRRGMLGAGLVEVPRVPYRDPSGAVLANPEVAERKRYCSNCGEPVGRSRGDREGRPEGFCPKCGTRFSFTPKLTPGDLVAGQYEVLGCLAHGGLGWIYLARDKNVEDRWVVLKGLLDTGDADALAAAAAERAFLATVEHPNIVKIYNFVRHAGDEYIIMEYVGGQSLKDILTARRNAGEDALPLGQSIAYALEVLQAFGYLHSQGLVYCDFKPDNVIQFEEQLRLIDLGGVRRLDDTEGAIYGTVGYQAPEIADVGPSVTSDLYTVGRALAVLSFPFKGYTGRWAADIPPRDEVPLLRRHESFDRFLRRATHRDPAFRFQDAAEMSEQLTGVLREVLSTDDGRPRPAASGLFGPERFAAGTAADVSATGAPAGAGAAAALPPLPPQDAADALPVPLVDGTDPAAGFLSGLTSLDPEQLAATLAGAPQQTHEVRLALVRVRIELGEAEAAWRLLDELGAQRPDDWRVDWYRAVALLAGGHMAEARDRFDGLYALLPGEAAPKLALAYCLEQPAPAEAARLYQLVWRTDQSYINAAFGLARVYLAAGDRASAVGVLDSVPRLSIRYVPAQAAAVATVVRGRPPGELDARELAGAGDRLALLDLDADRRDRLTLEVLRAALDWVAAGRDGTGAGPGAGTALMGVPLAEGPLRLRLEQTYRGMARRTHDREDRRELIDAANAVRPRTLL
ncbi:serine/threonine-protein kinase [Actinomadura parmotrematis]|uniref:non-specific serine/threonine protein kinase n=1 Tax=Actinomadura parmotrematis TaxID=2864039 RepID=A0ABS7FZV2_9ACTN|nr:serine/threonine-protein kinase [Actinomadura parmotrematis]MBW8485992.1 protein kinase [Actinomadura parmotrematis]